MATQGTIITISEAGCKYLSKHYAYSLKNKVLIVNTIQLPMIPHIAPLSDSCGGWLYTMAINDKYSQHRFDHLPIKYKQFYLSQIDQYKLYHKKLTANTNKFIYQTKFWLKQIAKYMANIPLTTNLIDTFRHLIMEDIGDTTKDNIITSFTDSLISNGYDQSIKTGLQALFDMYYNTLSEIKQYLIDVQAIVTHVDSFLDIDLGNGITHRTTLNDLFGKYPECKKQFLCDFDQGVTLMMDNVVPVILDSILSLNEYCTLVLPNLTAKQ